MCLALPGRVVELRGDEPVVFGTVDFDGTRREVCFASIPDIAVGEYVVVHVGFAIARVDEASAHETIAMFRDLGLLDEELASDVEPDTGDPDAAAPGAAAIAPSFEQRR